LVAVNGTAIIDCHHKGRAFFVQYTVSVALIGFEIRNCNASDAGGAILSGNNSDLLIANCTFINNTAGIDGGAITLQFDVNPRIERSRFHFNRVPWSSTSAFLCGSQDGGAIMLTVTSGSIIEDSVFTDNSACYGGAVYLLSTNNTQIRNSTFVQNTGIFGGAVAGANSEGQDVDLHILLCTFIHNSGVLGGAIWVLSPRNLKVVENVCNSNVANDTGGCIAVTFDWHSTEHDSVLFANNVMISNLAPVGGAVMIDYEANNTYTNNMHTFIGGWFINNTALSQGGALYINLPADPEKSVQREWGSWSKNATERSWLYYGNTNYLYGVTFRGNQANSDASSGGAMVINCGLTTIDSCCFENNRASSMGGGLLLGAPSTALTMRNTSFKSNQARYGEVIYSSAAGLLELSGNSFTGLSSANEFVNIVQGGVVNMLNSTLVCPPGSWFHDRTIQDYPLYQTPWGLVNTTTAALSCSQCSSGTYNLESARVLEGDVLNITCLECPGAAFCDGGADVYSLPTYWCGRGSATSSSLECLQCPAGYCGTGKRPWQHSCAGNRVGTLCGSCAEGYSEAFGTDDCLNDSECGALSWFLPAILGAGLVYVIVLVWVPIAHRPVWKSVTYFLQVVPLMITIENAGERMVFGIFSLDPSIVGIRVSACVWSGFTAVQKIASAYVLPIELLLELALLFAIHLLFVRTKQYLETRRASLVESTTESEGAENEQLVDPVDVSSIGNEEDEVLRAERDLFALTKSRYAGALAGILLLMYQGAVAGTMALLTCVMVGHQLRLLKAGDVTCYTAWQALLFVVLGGLLAPFPLLLVLVRRLLRRKSAEDIFGWKGAILQVLEGPYAPNRRWWESVSIFRRFVLVALATFVVHPIWRAIALFFGCCLVLSSHLYFHPFADRSYQHLETVFLAALMVIACLQTPPAVYSSIGLEFTGPTTDALASVTFTAIIFPILCAAMTALFLSISGPWCRCCQRTPMWFKNLVEPRLRLGGMHLQDPTSENSDDQSNWENSLGDQSAHS